MKSSSESTKKFTAKTSFRFSILAIAFSGLSVSASHAATFSLGGNARFGTNLYNNLDVKSGVTPNEGNTSAYLESRFLIRPDVVVDDRFSIKSEWILMQQAPTVGTATPEGFGTALDGSRSGLAGSNLLYIRRAYLNWASDWGVFSIGRMPKSWGLGLLYDAGDDVLADFGTTVDRAGFQAMLGNLIIGLGYEKPSEALLNNESDDAEAYELSLQYSNPESLFDVGLLYTRNVRSGTAALNTNLNSSNDLSIFTRKRMGNVQLGGELVSIGQSHRSNAMGTLIQADLMPGAAKFSFDFGYASAASDSHFSYNANYQPFLLLFRQSLGATKAGTVRGGLTGANAVGNSVTGDGGAGALLFKGNFGYGFSDNTYVLSTTLGYASLAREGSNASKALGVEWDLNFSQKWYDNFKTYYNFGLLFPGGAFGPAAQTAWGFQIRGALTF